MALLWRPPLIILAPYGPSSLTESGSQFEEIFVGLGAQRIKDLFEKAKKNSPCVIFIDEIDAVGGKRVHDHAYFRLTINELLTQMDGFKTDQKILVIGGVVGGFGDYQGTALVEPIYSLPGGPPDSEYY